MAEEKIIKKFNHLTMEELRAKHEERLKGKPKGGAYAWDTEEERESRRRNNEK